MKVTATAVFPFDSFEDMVPVLRHAWAAKRKFWLPVPFDLGEEDTDPTQRQPRSRVAFARLRRNGAECIEFHRIGISPPDVARNFNMGFKLLRDGKFVDTVGLCWTVSNRTLVGVNRKPRTKMEFESGEVNVRLAR